MTCKGAIVDCLSNYDCFESRNSDSQTFARKQSFDQSSLEGISTVSSLIDTDEEITSGFEDICQVVREKLKTFRQDMINISATMNESFAVSFCDNDLF